MSTEANQQRDFQIGTALRRRRESLDLELTQVAITLRIRREYLAALENDTLEGLPGPAYAMGFLRTYADYLGFDGAEVMRRYKASTDALNDKPNLIPPMPLTDRGVPGGGLFLLTTLVLIALGYGTWYYISSGKHQTLATVEPVPAPLAALAPPPPGPTLAPSATTPAQPAASAPGQQAQAPSTVASNSAPSAAPTVPNAAMPTLPASSPAAPPSTTIVQNNVSGLSTSATPAPDTQSGSAAAGTTPPAAPAPQQTAAADPGQGPIPDAAAPAPAPVPEGSGHVYGQPTPARIVVHAIGPSWIQVSDASGNVLTQRVMRPGDTYNAPDRKGLFMRAGNAGALQFLIDGRTVPPVGSPGQVKQHIDLDPSTLSHGAIH